MEKAVLTKMGIIAGSLIMIVMLAIGCNFLLRETPDPMVSNPDESFLTIGGITVTRGDLYKHFKTTDGIAHLLNHIDEIVLADYITTIDEDAVEQEYLLIKYGTNDADELQELYDEIAIDEDLGETIERNFATRVLAAGFDPDDEDDVERFLRLTLATRKATIDAHLDFLFSQYEQAVADGVDDATDPMDTILDFYHDRYRGEAVAIELVFANEAEADAFLQKHNLVPNFDDGIGLYEDDEVPIDEAEAFNEDNTRLLTDEEVLSYFILIYNELYAYRDALDETLSWDDLEAFDADWFHFDAYTMRNDRQRDQLERIFGYLGWQDPEEDDDDDNGDADEPSFVRYTPFATKYRIEHERYDKHYVMTFLLDHTEAPAFDDLDEARQEEIMAEYVRDSLGLDGRQQRFVNSTMVRLRHEHGFTIYDNALMIKYEGVTHQDYHHYLRYEENGGDLVASLDGYDLHADDYFEYMIRRGGAIALSEVFKRTMLIQGPYFEERFGTNRNFRESTNPVISEYRSHINTAYSTITQWGYPWEDYLLDEGYHDDFDYVEKRVFMDLIPLLYRDNIDLDLAQQKAQAMYDDYIHLKVENILVYVDMNGDLEPDNYLDFIEDHADRAAFEAMHRDLEDLILTKYEDGELLEDIADAYNAAVRIDEDSEWAIYINAGFKMMFQDLTPEDNQYINPHNIDRFVPVFGERLYRIYNDYYTLPERVEDDAVLDPYGSLETRFGLHVIQVGKGDAEDRFLAPSARFDDPEGEYDERFINPDSDVPTKDQIEAWMEAFIVNTLLGDGEIDVPSDLDHALGILLDSFLRSTVPNLEIQPIGTLFPRLTVTDPYGTFIIINTILDADPTFPLHNVRLHKMLEAWQGFHRMRLGLE